MGKNGFSRAAYDDTVRTHTSAGKSATDRGEQTVRRTGKLDPLVDPAEYGVIRPSRIRLEERPDGLFVVSVGAPVTTEYRVDTTGSMGDHVERALRALPSLCEPVAAVVPERDPFFCAGIFGDIVDQFVLCRGQFEVLADRMVNQLTLMHPEGNGGDATEDPQYGLFGAAYLTHAYQQRIGLRSYDFTATDAPARDVIDLKNLKRIFGSEVLEKVAENGHQLSSRDLPDTGDIVKDLLKRCHAFALIVGNSRETVSCWSRLYGRDRVVILPKTEHLPYVMAAIIGLSEGTLDLRSAKDFLAGQNLSKSAAGAIVDAVAHIPLGAQYALPNYHKQPKKGDVFRNKTDLWPIAPEEVPAAVTAHKEPTATQDGGWL